MTSKKKKKAKKYMKPINQVRRSRKIDGEMYYMNNFQNTLDVILSFNNKFFFNALRLKMKSWEEYFESSFVASNWKHVKASIRNKGKKAFANKLPFIIIDLFLGFIFDDMIENDIRFKLPRGKLFYFLTIEPRKRTYNKDYRFDTENMYYELNMIQQGKRRTKGLYYRAKLLDKTRARVSKKTLDGMKYSKKLKR